ncbi:hypothetical protein G5714_009412 [Onychostoma macrolepis]|uniref:Uncharacterized protein n=1 Tax=Onychostoma macrolepis TaxID=369639 RepID=A0A7J6CSF5_9TELE|nr:hypothetical protein G5714_009412 [Onychostoma macrolepis]
MAAKRPDQLYLFRLYLFDTVSLDLRRTPVSAFARQPYLFKSHAGDAYPPDTVGIVPVGRRREPPSQTSFRFILRSARLTRLTHHQPPWVSPACRTPSTCLFYPHTFSPAWRGLPVRYLLSLNLHRMLRGPSQSPGFLLPTCRQGYPSDIVVLISCRTLTLVSGGLLYLPPASEAHPFDAVSLDLRRMSREPPGRSTSSFPPTSAPLAFKQVSTLTSWMAAKRPDQLYLFRLYLFDTVSLDLRRTPMSAFTARQTYLFKSHAGGAYPSDTVGIVPVGRRREPPSQTSFRFILRSARLTRLTQ